MSTCDTSTLATFTSVVSWTVSSTFVALTLVRIIIKDEFTQALSSNVALKRITPLMKSRFNDTYTSDFEQTSWFIVKSRLYGTINFQIPLFIKYPL